jgi:uncharacterized membrane protein
MQNKVICFLLILFLNISLVSATNYYANVVIDVKENGDVQITGQSNHPLLKERISQDYTSKFKKYWKLDLNIDDIFEEYVFEVRFPKYAVVNYLKIPNILSMEEQNNQLIIISTGENKELRILAQYSINKKQHSKNILLFISFLMLAFSILVISYYLLNKNKHKKTKYNIDALTDRQKQIFNLIIKNKGKVTQSFLQKELNLPKASLSRNIDTLVRKEIIQKETKGMTNLITIKKDKNQ